MRLPRFLPEELRQLARFVPTRGWDAVEWRPLLGDLRNLSWRFLTGSGVRELGAETEAWLDGVTLEAPPDGAVPLEDLSHGGQLRSAGDRLLHLYFRQWLVDEGLFLDLRAGHFHYHERVLHYRPNGLWIRLRPEFREGMLALYRSFYSDDEASFEAALRQMGMLRPGLAGDAEAELKDLLHAHFGVDQGAQRFAIDRFKESFDQLFEFFLEHDYTLHSDFVFVGFYLITLYLTLEQGGQAHDVRTICARALGV